VAVKKNDFQTLAHQDLFKSVRQDESLLKPKKPAKSEGDYHSLPVVKLRKLARSIPDFPIKGREISKANRDLLIELLDKTFAGNP
jgi:hypothetical protein